jgi:hypothetical protein
MAQKRVEEFAPDSPMVDFLDVRLAYLTKQHYISRLKTFFDSLGLHGSLDRQSREFLAQARKDGGTEWAQNGLKYFIRAKKKRAENGELAEATIRNFYKPVRLFCSVHDIELSWKKITNTIPTGRKFANDRAPTHEEISRLIEYPDRRIKPLVLTTCSSGIRLGAWEYLKWKHIAPIRRDDRVVAAKIIVYAGENEQYFSFITPEAFEALEEWMEYRRTSGEDINGESWLMRTVWDTTTPRRSTIRSPKKMSREAIKQLVKRALKSEGLRSINLDMKVIRRYEWKMNHGFRKFFQTNAEPKMKSLDVMTLMGQDTGLAASYNKPTVEMLLDEYLKAVDNLTINKTSHSQMNEEMVKNQQALATEIQAKDQEMQALRNEILETKAAQQKKEDEMRVLKEQMAKMEESQLKITELLEVMKIAKSSNGKVGKDRTMLDEKRRVTIGYVDDNNQSVEMKVPLDGFEIDDA